MRFCKEGGDNRKNVKLAEVKLKFRSDSNKQNITIVTKIKIRIAQMNPTVDWIWYRATSHNNVNAGFDVCYFIAQFQNH